jgi:hypothetical protein
LLQERKGKIYRSELFQEVSAPPAGKGILEALGREEGEGRGGLKLGNEIVSNK